jgi:hypothetical protein
MTTVAPGVKLKFFDLTGESYREYTFPGYDTIMITGSVSGAIAHDGTHFIYDIGGKAHEIPPSWIHLTWMTIDPMFRWDNREKGKK